MIPLSLRALAALILAAAAAACTADGRGASPMPARVLGAVQELRTPPELEFDQITALAVDERGRMYVGNGAEVVILNPDGTVAGRLGREGMGPGEFRFVGNLALLPGDSLFVYDPGTRRVTVYPPRGTRPAYTTTFSGTQTSLASWAVPAGDGQIAALFRTAHGDVPGRENGGALPEVLRLLNADGSLRRDSVLTVPERQVLQFRNTEGRGMLHYPFARHTSVALSPSGRLYHGWTDSLAFVAHTLDGRRIGAFTVPVEPRPVTSAEIDSVVEALAGRPFSAQSVRRALRRTGTHTWPAFRTFLVDDRERLWVSLTPPRGATAVEWAVFDLEGTRFGAVSLPASVELGAVRGDRAYGVARDSLDVPSVVVYRLTLAPGEGARR